MIEVGAFEARNKLSALLDRVEQRQEIIITRHGRQVARLVANTEGIGRSQVQAGLQRMRARAAQAGFDWDTLKADRDVSRP